MALNNITFNKQNGGIGRQPLTNDHVSAIAFFATASNPLTGSVTEAQVFNETEAKNLGLTGDYLGRVGEYFRMNSSGNLYIGYYGSTASNDKILDLQNFAEGKIRQILVVKDTEAFGDTMISDLQDTADDLEAIYRPTQFVLEADFSAYTPVDIKATGRKNVSVVLGNSEGSGFNAGSTLLGVMSRSKVSESVAWVGRNNLASGTMYDTTMILGDNILNLTDTQLADYQDKGFITLRKFTDFSGVYFTDSTTADLQTSDFLYIENNRVIDKALRNLRSALLTDLSSPSYIKTDGSLSEGTIAYFTAKCDGVLNSMVNNLEISQGRVTINPSQNVLSTGELVISVEIIPVGINRKITLNLGFTTSF